jgi:hypothetical protein
MTQDDDRILKALAGLPPIAPDIEREIRVRARCHAVIARRALRQALAGQDLRGTGLIDLAAAAGLIFYLAAVIAEVARLVGLV